MSREWTPGDGDVAQISWTSPSGRSGGSSLALRCSHDYNESHWRTQAFGIIADHHVTSIRPLAVIDPDDREQVERLLNSSVHLAFVTSVGQMQAALREYANPTPPKPDEPKGLGAVVEDAEGKRYVRRVDGWWRGDEPCSLNWAAVPAVRVLSDGVTA